MANVKISALPSWTGSPVDLRWFVMNNSGETETFKFSGFTSPLKYGDGTNSIVPVYNTSASNVGLRATIVGGVGNTITSTQDSNSIFGGNSNSISSNDANGANTIVGGFSAGITNGGAAGIYTASATISSAGGIYNTIMGVQVGSITTGSRNAIVGGNYQTISSNNNGFIGGGNNNTITGDNCGSIGGQQNTASGTRSVVIGGFNNRPSGLDTVVVGGQNNLINSNGAYNVVAGGEQNTASGDINSIFNGRSNNVSGGIDNTIIGGNSNTLSTNSSRSIVIGGRENVLTRGDNCSIIGSRASTQNIGGLYNTSGVTMVSCIATDITNANHSVALGLSGRTIVGGTGDDNTTYVEKLYIYGNTRYETTIVNDPGTININVFEQSHVEINASGGTYDLVINPSPSTEGTPELTLLINYISSGATITFNNSGSSQWRWSSGTPSFTSGTRSIIKVAAWDTNDVWEISRSMNMS